MRNRLLHCCLLFLCSMRILSPAHGQLQKIYLHPKAAGTEKQSQFVDSIRFIPLEVKEGVELGAYNGVTVTENHFLVINYQEKMLVLYAKDGSFVRQINFKKLGDNVYPNYNEATNKIVFFGHNKNYSLTPKDEIKIRLDWSNPRNKKYFRKYIIDLSDSTFAIKRETPEESDVIGANYYYDDYFWQGRITTSPLFKDSLDHEFSLYKDKQLVKAFFPYNRVNEPRFLYVEEGVQLTKTDKAYTSFVTRPFCDTIYKMVKDSLFPAFHMVVPLENSLPATFFTQPFRNKTERENFERNNAWTLHQVHNFFETPQVAYFAVRYMRNFDFYIYHKRTNTTYKSKNIKADSNHYNLQLLSDFSVQRKGATFYKTQKAGDLTAFFASNKTISVPESLQAFLKSNPHSTAPVIVEFKLK
ncbi:6-bladed beta-propeller [Flavisolibacter sp. BT320]|nr:6-bladed beta-propeller [Flavisolibacter longurius]